MYAVIKSVNGSLAVAAEGLTDINAVKVNFHGLCQTLANASDVLNATVRVVDDNLNVLGEFYEHIEHPQTQGE